MNELIKELETGLGIIVQKFRQEIGQIRGNRPTPEMLQDIRINLYDQSLSIRELGSLAVLPPNTIQMTVWDKNAVGAVAKAVEEAHLGLSVATGDGNTVRATLSPLGDERREELTRLVKKTAEGARIQVRNRRDEIMKRAKDAEANKIATQDELFRGKEKVQKIVDKANADLESIVAAKLSDLGS